MSTSIDQRVVEMRFDNQHFERNVATSMSTLDKLKQKLRLSGATKGLEDIDAATKKVNIGVLGTAVETVTAKFSALQVMGVTALANITNSAVNAGKNIVKSLTIDPIMSGFSEYETKMGSIQTILANTEHQGTTLDDVVKVLDELNLYADKTIYNFQEMTRNIGTFTAAGVDLETSVKSIQGIANLAAVSGSTSQQASTAMYQLSQALASGTVKLMDWNSVVNAGMGGKVFQNALIRTAAVLDGSANDVAAWQKKNIDAYGSFRDSLSRGAWLTTEVLTATLEQFTMAAEEGSEEWEAYKKSLMETGYTAAQAEEILKMANTATDAATKVKTFTQLMDTLKESAQSGWAQTWELLIGDFEEAKAFFTQLSDIFGGIIGESADRRNNLLGGALNSNWDKLTANISEAGHQMTEFEESIRNLVGDDVLDPLIEKYGSLEKAVKNGAISSDILKKALDGIGVTSADSKISSIVEGLKSIERILRRGSVGDEVKKLQTALDALGYDLGAPGIDGIIGPITEAAIKEFQKANGLIADGIAGPETIAALEKAANGLGEVTGETNTLRESCDALIDDITKKGGRELLLESVLNIIKAIHRPLAAVGEAFRNTFSVSSDQVYNLLEGFNKFTDALVMKGPLDATNWRELSESLQDIGISIPEFTDKLAEALKANGVDVDALIEKYGSLGAAFNNGAISMDTIKEVLLGFKGVSETLLEGGETADKLRRTFEGLFAILEIIGTFATNGLSVAFRILKAILGAFDMDILGFTASVGDVIVAFRDWLFETNSIAKLFDWLISKLPVVINRFRSWFDVFKRTPVVQELITALQGIGEAFTKFFAGEIDSTELARTLGSNLAKALISLPKIAIQIGKDFIAGFKNGITGSITGVIDKIVNFCLEFVRAFAEALGVQSPSWKAFEIMCDFFQGAINGAKSIISKVLGVLKTIGEKIVEVFRQIWDLVTDESGNIEWGKVFSGGILIAITWFLKQITTAVGGVGSIADEFAGLVDATTKTMKSFKKVLNAYAWDLKAQALQKLAISLAILVGAIWVLSTIDDPKKLWNAVGIIAALAGILFALGFAMKLMSEASVSLDWKKGIDIKGLRSSLAQIGIAVLMMAAVVKLFGSMNPDELGQGLGVLAGLALGLVAFVAVLGVISRYSRDADKIGKMLTKITFAMLLMVGVVKLVDCLSADEMTKAAIFATAFGLFAMALIKVSKSAGNNVSKVGGLMLKLTVALGLMVGVVKLISLLSLGEMGKGALFAAGFTVFVKSLMNTAKIGKKQQLAKLGGLVLSIAAAMALMAGVVKIIGGLSMGEVFKGTLFVAAFAGIVWAIVHFLGKEDTQKISDISKSISGIATAIALLAVIAIALSFVPVDGLIKGVAAVAVLGLIMSGMIKALKGAQNIKGSLIAMTVAIGVMAASIVALSFIDPGRLIVATGAMAIIMGMFALIEKCSKNVTKSLGTLAVMTGAIGALALILGLLANSMSNPNGAIKAAIGIGILMATLVMSMKAIEKVGNIKLGAVGGLLVMTGVLALIAFVMGSLIQNGVIVGPSIETAVALGILIAALVASVAVLGLVKHVSVTALVAVGIMGVILAGLMWVMKLLAEDGTVIGPSIETATGLSILLLAMAGVTAILAALGPASVGALVGAAAFAGVVVILGALMVALGALNKYWPDMETFLDEGIDILEKIGVGIGKFVGGLIGGVGEGLMDSVVSMVETFGVAVDKLAVVAESAAGIDATSFDGVGAFIKLMGDIALVTVGTSVSDIFTLGGTSMEKFGTDGVEFFKAMKKITKEAKGITVDEAAFDAVVKAGTKLTELQSTIEPIGGLADALVGSDDLATFGSNVNDFIKQIKTAFSNVTGFTFDSDALANIISAAGDLSGLQHDVEAIGGVVDWFTGRDDLGKFGENVATFIDQITIAFKDLKGFTFDSTALANIISAASDLSTLQHDVEAIGGVVDWFVGEDDLGKFGENVSTFIDVMEDALEDLEGFTYDTTALQNLINAAVKLSTLQEDLPNIGGVVDWFTGQDDLATFGENVSAFAEAMDDAFYYLDDLDIDLTVIDEVILVCNKFSDFIDVLDDLDLDMEAAQDFTGLGAGEGWFGPDGPLHNIAVAIADMDETMGNLDVFEIDSAADAIIDFANAIDKIATLNGKGLDKFTGIGVGKEGADGYIHTIGLAVKDFNDTVAGLDHSDMSNAIKCADAMATFINKLASIDITGVDAFVGVDGDGVSYKVAAAISSYATGVADIKLNSVMQSVSAVQALAKTFDMLSSVKTEGVTGFVTAVDELATSDFSGFVETFSGGSDISDLGSGMINSIAKGIVDNMSHITDALALIKVPILSALENMSMLLMRGGVTIVNEFIKGIKTGAPGVTKTASSMVLTAARAARSGYNAFFSAGSYMVTGFANGIKANTYRAEARSRAMARAAANAAKKELDIHSPSRVGYAIGDFFGVGFVNAIGDHVKTAYRSSAEMAASAKNGLKDSISKISDLISSDMDAQPTIRPVLDLSDVRAGAGAIGSLLGADSSIGVMSNLNSISTMMNRRGQNGGTGEVVSAIDRLRKDLGNVGGTSYNINGITYDRGSELDDAIRTIVRYARIEGRA